MADAARRGRGEDPRGAQRGLREERLRRPRQIDTALRAFTKELKEGTNVQLTYAAGPKTTTIKVEGDGTATIPGSDFMRGTWSIWLGNFDQPALSEALISRIPDTPKAGG